MFLILMHKAQPDIPATSVLLVSVFGDSLVPGVIESKIYAFGGGRQTSSDWEREMGEER